MDVNCRLTAPAKPQAHEAVHHQFSLLGGTCIMVLPCARQWRARWKGAQNCAKAPLWVPTSQAACLTATLLLPQEIAERIHRLMQQVRGGPSSMFPPSTSLGQGHARVPEHTLHEDNIGDQEPEYDPGRREEMTLL